MKSRLFSIVNTLIFAISITLTSCVIHEHRPVRTVVVAPARPVRVVKVKPARPVKVVKTRPAKVIVVKPGRGNGRYK